MPAIQSSAPSKPPRFSTLALRSGGLRATIHHGHADGDQRNTIGDAVVNADYQHAATVVVFNQMQLPQRPARIERLHRQFGDAVLQRILLLAFG